VVPFNVYRNAGGGSDDAGTRFTISDYREFHVSLQHNSIPFVFREAGFM
jgi:hypothetical protein